MREIPKPRQIEIFRQLMMAGVPLDIATLKEKLQKSERTIRRSAKQESWCGPGTLPF